MTSLTLSKLDNAARDLQTIDDFANSATPTITTRGGAVVPSRAGLTAEFPQAAANAAAAAGSAGAAADSAGAASRSAVAAATSQSLADGSRLAAQTASATVGAYPASAASNVPRGLTQASVGAITPGAGGTNGTFALAWTAGNFLINPTGTFTVAGGALTAVAITGPGLYIGAAPTVPTPSFAASAGLAGAGVALTPQFLVTAGQGYWVQSLDGFTLQRYTNTAGVATRDTSVGDLYLPSSVAGLTKSLQKAAGSAVPVSALLASKGTTRSVSTGTALLGTWIHTFAPTAAPNGGYLSTVRVKHLTALVGRKCEFYICRPAGAGVYTFVWASGLIPTEASGVNIINLPPDPAGIMQPGDFIGVFCNAAANGDGVMYNNSAGNADGTLRLTTTARPIVGGTAQGGVGGYIADTTLVPQISYTIKPVEFIPTIDWSGQPHGIPRLDALGRVHPSMALFGGGAQRSTANTTAATENGEYVFRPVALDTTTVLTNTVNGAPNVYPTNHPDAHVFYKGSAPGFAQPGYLAEIRIEAGNPIPAGCKLQVFVIRPTSAPPTSGTPASSFTARVVAKIGEYDLSALGAQAPGAASLAPTPAIVLKGMMTRVLAGDMVMLRGPVGFGFRHYAGHADYNDDCDYKCGQTDLTMAAFDDEEFTLNGVGAFRRLLWSYRVVDADYLATLDGPNAFPRTDSLGNLSLSVARAPDLPLKNKKIAFTGSSISTPSGGGNATDTGHLVLAAQKLQCTASQLGLGSTFVCWKPASATGNSAEHLTLGATAAELTARFGASEAQWSYENRLIGKGFDGVVLHDAINDTNDGNFSVGAWGDATPQTYYGVMTRLIEALLTDNPNMLIWLQTPFHRWASYNTPGNYPVEQANRAAFQAAAYDLTDRYGLRPVIDYMKHVQCNRITVKNGVALFDSIHPTQLMKNSAGQYVYSVMNEG